MNRYPRTKKVLHNLVLFTIFADPAFCADVIYDQFVDGNRTAQTPALGSTPYTSIPWYCSNTAYVSASTAGLKVTPSSPTAAVWVWAYYTPTGAPVSLQTGDSISLSFEYTYNSDFTGVANMFRFGLFDGGTGARIVSDGTGMPQTTLRGYAMHTNAQTSDPAGSAIYVENNAGNAGNPFTTTGGGTYVKMANTFPSIDATNVTRTARMTVKRISTGVHLTVDTDLTTTGDEVTRTITGNVLTTFDSVAFCHVALGNVNRWITMKNIRVEHLVNTSVVLYDLFTDGDRTSQVPALGLPPYSSVPWHASNSAYMSTSTSGLRMTPSGGSGWTWAYFTTPGSTLTLDSNESLCLTFDYIYNANHGGVANMLRFGLFNGGTGARVTADGTAMAQTTLQGYTVQTNSQTASAAGSAVYVENNDGSAGSAFTTSGGGTYTKVGADFPSVDASNATRTAQMVVTRTGSGVDITVDTNLASPGDEVTRSLAGDVLSSFDAVGFCHQSMGDVTKWITFSNITVEGSPAITVDPLKPSGGFGTDTHGGLDGTVVKVTSLADSGSGTLRAALQQSGARTVVFEVSGQINLTNLININSPFITVAGETAPSPGITLTGAPIRITTHDVVIRHLRLRIGNAPGGYSLDDRDGFQLIGVTTEPASPVVYNVVIDHCSVSWAVDECISTYFHGVSDVTISNCIVSEALKNAGHSKGEHPMAVLIGALTKRAAVIGTIFAHNGYRNPVVSGGATAIVANNIIYNFTHNGFHTYGVSNPGSYGYNQPVDVSVLNNVLIAGPEQAATRPFYWVDTQGAADCTLQTSRIYFDGNLIPSASTLVLNNAPYAPMTPVVFTPPITLPSLSLLPASEVEAALLQRSGARPKDRDAVDLRIVSEVQTRTGHSINTQNDVGGWPVLAQNTRVLTPPANPQGDSDGDGDNNLEEWLDQYRQQVEY